MHQLFVALREMLVHHQRVVDHLDVGHDAEAGIGLGVIILRRAGQGVDMGEHHRQPEIGRQGLNVGLGDVHQLALVLDPALAEQDVGV